ncbi:rhomboid protease GluP [Alkalibacillus flavidus]|uniref:Rhomboid protease GluP n=1 Tax=Alkalibacillus flavidus TaxID=546021 RepID=A0ABV2KXF9_9BACI
MLKLIDSLLNHDYTIRFISDARDFIVLEKYHKNMSHIVAVSHQMFDWSNHLERDYNHKLQFLNQNARLFRGKQKRYHVVYVSDLAPVDDWERLKSHSSDDAKPKLYYWNEHDLTEEIERLKEQLSLPTYQLNELLDHQLSEEELDRQVVYLEQKIISYHQAKQREFNRVFFFGKTRLTYILVLVNVFVFGLLEMNGSSTDTMHLIDWGAKYNPAIANGEWWRIGSSMFLHIGALHLMMNMLALYFLGDVTEKIYGTYRFFIIYSLAGLFGGIASFAMNDAVAAGASGAIFGLFGALLFFGMNYRELFFKTIGTNLLFIVGLNIMLGFTVPQIDNGAHLGGLLGGFLAAQIIQLPYKRQWFRAALASVLMLLLIVSMAYYGYQDADQPENPQALALLAQDYLEQENYEDMIDMLSTSLEDDIQHEYIYFYRAIGFLETEQFHEAETDLQQAIDLNPRLAEAHYNLGVLYAETDRQEEAIQSIERALDLNPDEEQFQSFYDQLKNE